MYIDSLNQNNQLNVLSGTNNVCICNGTINEDKEIIIPNGYNPLVDKLISIDVLFQNGHNPITSSSYLYVKCKDIHGNYIEDEGITKQIPIVVNKHGTLINLPNTEFTSSVFKCLQPNTILKLYYDTPTEFPNGCFVVIGNPVILSSNSYTVYANGDINHLYVHNIHQQLFSNAGTSALQTFDLYTLGLTKDQNGLYEVGINLAMYDDDEFKCYVYSDVDGDNSNNAPGMTAANTNYHIQGTTNTRHCFINMKIFVSRYLYFRAVQQGEQVTLNVISVKPIRSTFIEDSLS